MVKTHTIGILLCGYDRPEMSNIHGPYADQFAYLLQDDAFAFKTYAVIDGNFPQSVNECDGWLITGSAYGAYDNAPFIKPLEQFIQQAYAQETPQVGICFGHQILAQALGGTVEKFKGGWAMGATDYTVETENGDENHTLYAMHQDQVVELPADASLIASSDFCKIAGLKYKKPVISFQPHPEFSHAFMTDLVNLRAGVGFPQEVADKALKTMNRPTTSHLIANQIKSFLKAHIKINQTEMI